MNNEWRGRKEIHNVLKVVTQNEEKKNKKRMKESMDGWRQSEKERR